MSALRFIIDDAEVCATQKAVLRTYADALRQLGHLVQWGAAVTAPAAWADAPKESARRLALRCAALRSKDMPTVFLPGHIVPEVPPSDAAITAPLVSASFNDVADLDVFAVQGVNDNIDRLFHAQTPKYDFVARTTGLSATPPPAWLGNMSCLRFDDRPWYNAYAPQRAAWLAWVQRAVQAGHLTAKMIAADIMAGNVRPSLQVDMTQLMAGGAAAPAAFYPLDTVFIAPECRLTPAQRKLLYSKDLQIRTRKFAKSSVFRKHFKVKKTNWGTFISFVTAARFLAMDLLYDYLKAARRSIKKSRFSPYTAYKNTVHAILHYKKQYKLGFRRRG